LPLIAYFSIFAIHLELLTKSGPGDAFMTPAFQKTLAGNNYQKSSDIKPLNLFDKSVELNIEMYRANATLTAGHPYSSKWYTWPFMARPIYYWHENSPGTTGKESRIYFLGNPVIWWASTAAIIYSLFVLTRDIIRRKPKNKTLAFLGGAYLFNLLPFIGITRAMFLYHYMIGLVLAIIALAYLIDGLKNKKRAFVTLLIASLAVFIFFLPLTYGLPLDNAAYNTRVWLPSWR
jgi:dolichyl-phosphate-mannose--protein O-mannosyl transferase